MIATFFRQQQAQRQEQQQHKKQQHKQPFLSRIPSSSYEPQRHNHALQLLLRRQGSGGVSGLRTRHRSSTVTTAILAVLTFTTNIQVYSLTSLSNNYYRRRSFSFFSSSSSFLSSTSLSSHAVRVDGGRGGSSSSGYRPCSWLTTASIIRRPTTTTTRTITTGAATTTTTRALSTTLRGGEQSPGHRGWSLSSHQLLSTTVDTTESTSETSTMTSSSSPLSALEKLTALRKKMKEVDVHVYLVPSDDPHLSEYTPDAYRRRGFLTDFHGSAGTAVVTRLPATTWQEEEKGKEAVVEEEQEQQCSSCSSNNKEMAYLWTDSRYWNEATLQLDASCWTLFKQGLPSTPSIVKWLTRTAILHYKATSQPLKVGIDPFVHPASFPKDLITAWTDAQRDELVVQDKHKDNDEKEDDDDVDSTKRTTTTSPVIGELVTLENNLVDAIWTDRPALPLSPFRVHPLDYAGTSLDDKVAQVREAMARGGVTAAAAAANGSNAQLTSSNNKAPVTLAVFCTLDDVAYLLNLRAKGDIDTCPVGIAYATVSMDEVCLYCDKAKLVSPQVQEHLQNVTIRLYDAIVSDVAAHCSEKNKLSSNSSNRVWLDKSRANYAISQVIPPNLLLDSQNAVVPMKACKNKAELEGMRQAHLVDGAAMAEFMAWLEDVIVNQGRVVSEVEIDEQLTACRAKQPGFIEVSFPTIAGVGSNGAIIHYRAEESSDLLKYLDRNNPILIDSGGQYTYGTTDVTRTWHFGTANDEFRDVYTRILKGNIGVDAMVFPEHSTPGFVLDVFARQWLWQAGRDYGHGTGHGVGAALNVHEGPHSISPRWANKEVLKRGMVVSNEPGFYADGEFGIRIENLLEVQYVEEDEDNNKANGDATAEVTTKLTEPVAVDKKKFLKFSKLTMIPIQKNLIDLQLMSTMELDWLDAYHEEVFAKVSPYLAEDSPAMTWLTKSCAKIERL